MSVGLGLQTEVVEGIETDQRKSSLARRRLQPGLVRLRLDASHHQLPGLQVQPLSTHRRRQVAGAVMKKQNRFLGQARLRFRYF